MIRTGSHNSALGHACAVLSIRASRMCHNTKRLFLRIYIGILQGIVFNIHCRLAAFQFEVRSCSGQQQEARHPAQPKPPLLRGRGLAFRHFRLHGGHSTTKKGQLLASRRWLSSPRPKQMYFSLEPLPGFRATAVLIATSWRPAGSEGQLLFAPRL